MAKDKLTPEYQKDYVLMCRAESESVKQPRMDLNKANNAQYQLDHDFSHKRPGQSQEVLGKTRLAGEQARASFQQALTDLDDWWRINCRYTNQDIEQAMPVRPEELYKLTNYMLKEADYFTHVGNSIHSGLFGSLMISQVTGKMVNKPKFKVETKGRGSKLEKNVVVSDNKAWQLKLENIRQEDYFPDPTNAKLYEIRECMLDYYLVKQLADGDNAIYDKSAVEELEPYRTPGESESKKADAVGEASRDGMSRPQIKITEFYGNVVDVEDGELLAENVLITLANDEVIIREATPNPLWHQRSDIVAATMIDVPHSVWGVALMDAGTKHNHALTEIFNLMLDGALKAVWGVTQTRVDALMDPKQAEGGIRWGTNFLVNSTLQQGAKVMEEVITGNVQPDVISIYNLLNQETLSSMFTNDLRLGGQSMRATKATEVVAAENSITGVFTGIAKNVESRKIQPELELAVLTIAQNWDEIDPEVFKGLFGDERGEALAQLSPQDVFVAVVNSCKFEVFGISIALRRNADYRKWMTLLQSISSSEVLIEAFLAKYSFEKLLGEIMQAIDLDKTKIEHGKGEGGAAPTAAQPMMQPGGAPGAMPQMMSQVPQASSNPSPGLAGAFAQPMMLGGQ